MNFRGFLGKEPTCQGRRLKRLKFNPFVEKIPQRREWQPNPVFMPGESHGERNPQSIGSERAGHD